MMLRRHFIILLTLVLSCGFTAVFSQNKEVPLWETVPNAVENEAYKETFRVDKKGVVNAVRNVKKPTLKLFLANNSKTDNTAVVICPGGGYSVLSHIKEGDKIAEWFNSIGVSAFVLKYRLPSDLIMKDKTIGPLQDAQEAMRMVRRHAKEWNINPNKVGVIGFSAGGHLAATLSTQYNEIVYPLDTTSARPDFSILIYPVISMKDSVTHQGSKLHLLGKKPSKALVCKYSNETKVDAKTPPTFLIHATNDKGVLAENSINYYLALKKNNIQTEMHLYKDGGHGFGLGKKGTHSNWPKACKNWLIANRLISEKEMYMFSYFKENGEDGLHLAYSEDGYIWKSLKSDASFLTPEVGKDKLMRDPCIIKGSDGLYHMIWTVSWTDKGIGYANSKDLMNWSQQQFIPVMQHEKGILNTWAPEITYDTERKAYMIYWASTIEGKFPEKQISEDKGYNHRIYYTITKDFKTFSDTKLLYDPGFNVIDATIHKQNNKYVMFLKDETKKPVQKNLKTAYSDSLTGPYTKASEPITGNYWAEGPTATKIDGKWTVYFDKYTDHKYGAIQSIDLKTWKDISDKIEFPDGVRHGSVFKISLEAFLNLQR